MKIKAKNVLLIVIAVCVFMGSGSYYLFACICSDDSNPIEAFAKADAIFKGQT